MWGCGCAGGCVSQALTALQTIPSLCLGACSSFLGSAGLGTGSCRGLNIPVCAERPGCISPRNTRLGQCPRVPLSECCRFTLWILPHMGPHRGCGEEPCPDWDSVHKTGPLQPREIFSPEVLCFLLVQESVRTTDTHTVEAGVTASC